MSRRITPWKDQDHAPQELVAKIKARRENGTLIELDRMLLKSFPLAEGWNELLRRIRTELSVDVHYRELLICRVAQLNHADFEWGQHAPLYLKNSGTQAQLDSLNEWKTSPLFNATEKAVLALCDESTRNVQVSDATFEAAKKFLGETATVESVAVIAAYNMVSRFLVALDVGGH